MSFFDAPDYLELPESLMVACNEDDRDNVSSESGGGTSSGGSLGSISNTCATGTSATMFETSNDSISSNQGSIKTTLEKPKEAVNHDMINQLNSDRVDLNKQCKQAKSVDSISEPKSVLNSGKEDISKLQGADEKIPETKICHDPVTFGWKTKAVIYGSVFSCIGYFIYTYWHIILMSLVALFFYEMWDMYSARKKSASTKRSD